MSKSKASEVGTTSGQASIKSTPPVDPVRRCNHCGGRSELMIGHGFICEDCGRIEDAPSRR